MGLSAEDTIDLKPGEKAGLYSWRRMRHRDRKGLDIIREDEIEKILGRALSGVIYKHPTEVLKKKGACLVALLAIFGKRRGEIAPLQKRDFNIEEGFLKARFRVLKKLKRKALCPYCDKTIGKKDRFCKGCGRPIEEKPKEIIVGKIPVVFKQITLKHPLVKHITTYLELLPDSDNYLFPAGNNKRKVKKGKDLPYMQPTSISTLISRLDQNASPHLYRHALATTIAEREGTEDQLLSWFDWSAESAAIAHGYVKRSSPRLTKDISERTW